MLSFLSFILTAAVLIYIEIYWFLRMAAGFLTSLASSVSGIRVVLFLLVLLGVAVWLLLKELREKEELQRLLTRALEGKPISPKEVAALGPQLNQVRLRSEERE
jgi:hypothetical protein